MSDIENCHFPKADFPGGLRTPAPAHGTSGRRAGIRNPSHMQTFGSIVTAARFEAFPDAAAAKQSLTPSGPNKTSFGNRSALPVALCPRYSASQGAEGVTRHGFDVAR